MKRGFQYSNTRNEILHIFVDSFIFCLKTVIVASSFGVSNSEPALTIEIFSLKVVIFACCLCSNVCAGLELETPYEQATITALRLNMNKSAGLSRKGLEKTDFIMSSSLEECDCHSPCKIRSDSFGSLWEL